MHVDCVVCTQWVENKVCVCSMNKPRNMYAYISVLSVCNVLKPCLHNVPHVMFIINVWLISSGSKQCGPLAQRNHISRFSFIKQMCISIRWVKTTLVPSSIEQQRIVLISTVIGITTQALGITVLPWGFGRFHVSHHEVLSTHVFKTLRDLKYHALQISHPVWNCPSPSSTLFRCVYSALGSRFFANILWHVPDKLR